MSALKDTAYCCYNWFKTIRIILRTKLFCCLFVVLFVFVLFVCFFVCLFVGFFRGLCFLVSLFCYVSKFLCLDFLFLFFY